MPTAATQLLPTYTLYGEQGDRPSTECMHCESIAERSRRHDWVIRPHRHEALFQILYIRRGRGVLTLDSQVLPLKGPCVVCVPALAAHGYRFEPGIDGHVFTVLQAHLARLLASEPTLRARLLQAALLKLTALAAQPVERAVNQLRSEFHAAQAWRSIAIDAALASLVVALDRAAPRVAAQAPRAGSRALVHLERYRARVEECFRSQPSLVSIALLLGITPTQLNRVCRQLTGRSALALLHARVLLEAQRELTYTNLSVKQVALGLGFNDAGYFTRFFQRLSGRTPTQWRGAAQAAGG